MGTGWQAGVTHTSGRQQAKGLVTVEALNSLDKVLGLHQHADKSVTLSYCTVAVMLA